MPDERGERPEMVNDALLHQHARLAGDLFQIDTQTWAIHGFIPVDGEVILAEFDHPEAARTFLDQLAAAEDRDGSE
ncbi:MAG TPA: hypothetical protein VLL25_13315 [Acidimicrobiales bacterium]|nr:hypothetical protein [Acidimicrobiales bacterium]